MVIDISQTHTFNYIQKESFLHAWGDNNSIFWEICFDGMRYDTLNLSFEEKFCEDIGIDFRSVERDANKSILYLEQMFYASNSPEEMEIQYNRYVDALLSRRNNKYEYLCLKLYTDMYLSSFTTWCNILYGNENTMFKKKKGSWLSSAWNSVKHTAKKVWNEVKPIVAADANGAVAGAMTGAVAGGVHGAGAGAAIGATATSAGVCAERLVNSLK